MGGDISSIIDMFGNMMNFGNGSARLTSPILDLTAVTGQVRLSFFRRQTTMMVPQTLYVYYRTSPTYSMPTTFLALRATKLAMVPVPV